LKPATLRVHLAILRRVLGLLEREGAIPKNPARRIGEILRRVGSAGASETEEVEHWTRGEVETLIRLARRHEPRFVPLLALLFATGLRRGEGLGIQWPDVDFGSRILTVRRAVTKERHDAQERQVPPRADDARPCRRAVRSPGGAAG